MDPKPRARYVPAAVIFCLGLFLTVVLCFIWQRYSYKARVQAEFMQRASSWSDALQIEVERFLEALESVSAVYATNRHVDREEFRKFAHQEEKEHPAIKALAWVPHVPEAQRPAFEESLRAEGSADAQIVEPASTGQLVRAEQRAEFFPVYFVEPDAEPVAAPGFDLAANSTWRAVLEKAWNTGKMAATPPYTLTQETGQQAGVFVFLPIYHHGRPSDTWEERRANLQGFVLLVLHTDDVIRKALQGRDSAGMTMSVTDEAAP